MDFSGKLWSMAKAIFFFCVVCLASWHACNAYAEDLAAEIRLREDAPVYSGPVQEGDLEALALDDFEAFGDQAFIPEEQYRKYQKVLADPPAGIQVPYRMKVIDRDMTLEDFFGFNVSEELSNARYESYVSMNPETIGGRTIHYAYVYHSPLPQTETEASSPEREQGDIALRKEA